ncbi:hypothetical protein WMF45_28795 [Sorangium sp. So ce448]|uniref:hypothetical protein n=1 Tax=Sorangium sp. So ce448 TaxID=3133314 RepID=UPI003F622513
MALRRQVDEDHAIASEGAVQDLIGAIELLEIHALRVVRIVTAERAMRQIRVERHERKRSVNE